MIQAARDAGWTVDILHASLLDDQRDKTSLLRNPLAIVRLIFRSLFAYLSLIFRYTRVSRTCHLVMIGYIGQIDVLILGPFVRLSGKLLVFNPLVTLTDTLVDDRQLVSASSIPGRLIWLLDWLALRIPSRVIADTSLNRDYLVDRFGIAPEKIEVIPVGAEAMFHSDEPGSSTQATRIHVLFYGKLIPLHGIETILCTVARLCENRNVSFEIIGSGQLEGRVRQMRNELSLSSENIVFRDWVAYQRLPARIEQADVVLGIFGDTEKAARVIPNKVYQAAAKGRAIITRDSVAIREMFAHGESIHLIEPDDPDALAEALETLCDPVYRVRLAQGAWQAIQQHATSAQMAQHVGLLLDRMIPAATSDAFAGAAQSE